METTRSRSRSRLRHATRVDKARSRLPKVSATLKDATSAAKESMAKFYALPAPSLVALLVQKDGSKMLQEK